MRCASPRILSASFALLLMACGGTEPRDDPPVDLPGKIVFASGGTSADIYLVNGSDLEGGFGEKSHSDRYSTLAVREPDGWHLSHKMILTMTTAVAEHRKEPLVGWRIGVVCLGPEVCNRKIARAVSQGSVFL
jgi:hypothetical protein